MTEIYDDRTSSTPIMYKKGDEIYSAEEYYRFFGKPFAFVHNTQEPGQTYQPVSSNISARTSASTTSSDSPEDMSWIVGILVGVAVLVGIIEIQGLLQGDWNFIAVFLLGAVISAVVSLFTNKWTTIVLATDFISCFVGLLDGEALLALLIGPFLFAPPAVICGTVFFLIRMAIESLLESRKSKKQLKENTEHSEKIPSVSNTPQSNELLKFMSILDIKNPNNRYEIERAFRKLSSVYHPNYGTHPSRSKYDDVVKAHDYLLNSLK